MEMTKQDLINSLLRQIEKSDLVSGDQVLIPRQEAIMIVKLLTGQEEVPKPSADPAGKRLFCCMDCCESFLAEGREDKEWFEKWHYHVWHADCPDCHREIAQTDRYWR